MPREKRHGIHTNSALPFHNDMGCEVLTLLYRQVAAQGGATSLASAVAIYNDLMKQPEILETLEAADWPIQLSVKNSIFEKMPLLAYHDGHVISEFYIYITFPTPNEYITNISPVSADPGRLGLHPATAKETSEGTRLTGAQLQALKVLNELAEKHAVSIPAQPGDILFINNLAVLHKRDSYVDDDTDADADAKKANGTADDTKRRWLMRLWLRNEDLAWEIPEKMKLPWEAAYGKDVGRLIDPKYDPSPQPDYKEPRYTSGTAAWLIEDEEA